MAFRLSTLLFLQFAIQGAWIPIFASHLKRLEILPMDAAIVFATHSLGALLAPLVWSQIADRWLSADKCICLCALVAGTLLWFLALEDRPPRLFWGFLIYWMFQVPSLSLSYALIFRHLEFPERDYSKIRVWGTVGWIVASWTMVLWIQGGEPNSRDTYAGAFRWGAILGWVLGAYCMTLPPTPPMKSPASSMPTAGALRVLWKVLDAPLRAISLFRRRSFAVFCFTLFGVFVAWPFNLQMMPLEIESLGITPRQLPLVLTIAQSSEVITMGLLPFFLLRLELKNTMILGIGSFLAALCVLTLAGPLWLVVGSLFLHGFFITCFLVAGQVFIHSQAEADFRASVQGLNVVINGAGMLLGNFLVGLIRDRVGADFTRAFLPATIAMAVLTVMFMLAFRTEVVAKDRVE